MSDEQDRAEALDDEVFADDEPDNDDRFEELAPEENYPPDQPQGVVDEGRFEIEDDVARRSRREEGEPGHLQ